jgi:hypothetical protein
MCAFYFKYSIMMFCTGITAKLGEFLRVELNYSIPLRQQAGDLAAPGIQFGVGLDFL